MLQLSVLVHVNRSSNLLNTRDGEARHNISLYRQVFGQENIVGVQIGVIALHHN
jgi:hypothetical protein